MPRPISRLVLIRKLKKLGFVGPYSGGKHEFMEKGNLRLAIPNPHRGDIGVKLMGIILKQIDLLPEDFDAL
ncbi:MAG TPA: type II toxin-antitoxin system HicA family toxin [Candidatus Paceibacterota bacterium]